MIRRRIEEWLEKPSITPMMLKAFTVAAFALAVIVPLALIAMPYLEFFNDMAVQPKGKSQMVWFKEGPEERRAIPGILEPASGTVAHHVYPYPFPSAEIAVAELAASEMALSVAPLPAVYRSPKPTIETMKEGQKLFNIYCIVCHGEYGLGDGTVAKKGFPAPPSLLEKRARQYSDERVFHIITMGQKVMPAYRSQIRPEDRWKIAHYVRALQRAFSQPEPEQHHE
jgi:mono/diheme cytochrome c family protein